MAWQRGESGNPGGRPSLRRLAIEELLHETWTPASRKKVLKRMVTDAENGDHDARVLLLAYAYGKPKDTIETTGALRIEVIYVDADFTEAASDAEDSSRTGRAV